MTAALDRPAAASLGALSGALLPKEGEGEGEGEEEGVGALEGEVPGERVGVGEGLLEGDMAFGASSL